MRLRTVALIAGLLAVLAAPRATEAQAAGKVARIGYLSGGGATSEAPLLDEFRQGLRQLGYSEGQTLTIETRLAEGRVEKLPDLAEELLRLKVDVLFTRGTPATLAAKRATASLPIVAITGNPVEFGLVSSLAKPGGNITGLTITGDLVVKRLELLKEAAPRSSRFAVLWNPLNPSLAQELGSLQEPARTLGVSLQPVEVRQPGDLESAWAAIRTARSDALVTLADTLIHAHRQQVVEFAMKARLPAMYPEREYVDAGGLMAYGPSLRDLYRRAAIHVDKVLNGAKPRDLPIEQPTKFELIINLKSARALGLTIPQSLLIRADQIIE